MKTLLATLLTLLLSLSASAQTAKVYDENIDPVAQIDAALIRAATDGKHVIAQVGGNWCPWCLRFAAFITADEEINALISRSFVYIHVNYPRRGTGSPSAAAMAKLGNPSRFGFPVMVVLAADGRVLHTQDSSFLEEGKGYNRDKTLRFLKNWTPEAVAQK